MIDCRWHGSFSFFFRLVLSLLITVFSAYFGFLFLDGTCSTVRKPFSFTCSYWPTELPCVPRWCTLSWVWNDAQHPEGRQLCQYLTEERGKGWREKKRENRWLPAFMIGEKEILRYREPCSWRRFMSASIMAHTICRAEYERRCSTPYTGDRSQPFLNSFRSESSLSSCQKHVIALMPGAIIYDHHRWFRWRELSSLSTFPTHWHLDVNVTANPTRRK